MVHFEADAEPAQPLDPAAEQRRGLEGFRINAAAGGLEGFHAEVGGPIAESGGIETGDEAFPDFRRLVRAGVAGDEAVERFAVGEIQPAFSSDEEFPADGRFAVEKRDLQPCRGGHLRRAEAGRAAADDGELGVGGQGREPTAPHHRVKRVG